MSEEKIALSALEQAKKSPIRAHLFVYRSLTTEAAERKFNELIKSGYKVVGHNDDLKTVMMIKG